MSLFDRVEFDDLVPDEERGFDDRKLPAMISSIRMQRCVCNPIQVREIVGTTKYRVADGMLRYTALSRLPFSHPARLSIPVEIL